MIYILASKLNPHNAFRIVRKNYFKYQVLNMLNNAAEKLDNFDMKLAFSN